MSTEDDKIKAELAAAHATLEGVEAKAKAEEVSLVNRVKPHLVAIGFGLGALLGFIAGKVHL